MRQVTVSIKTDKKVKEDFSYFCDEVGLNMSSAINMFMKTVLREQRIPFEIGIKNVNADTKMILDDVLREQNLSCEFNSVEDLMRDLNA